MLSPPGTARARPVARGQARPPRRARRRACQKAGGPARGQAARGTAPTCAAGGTRTVSCARAATRRPRGPSARRST
eukprot:1258972-Prymnesium_polylepis.1